MSNAVDVNDSVSLANDLRPILLRLARHLRSEVHSSGLTAAQIAILVAIEFHPGMTAHTLAEREGVSESGMSGHLALLEGKGLIWRERIVDRRSVGVFLTAGGREVLAGVRRRRTTWLNARLEQMTQQERDLIRASLSALDRLSMAAVEDEQA
jgi:DNA-binding MarR family transcriptional regulator